MCGGGGGGSGGRPTPARLGEAGAVAGGLSLPRPDQASALASSDMFSLRPCRGWLCCADARPLLVPVMVVVMVMGVCVPCRIVSLSFRVSACTVPASTPTDFSVSQYQLIQPYPTVVSLPSAPCPCGQSISLSSPLFLRLQVQLPRGPARGAHHARRGRLTGWGQEGRQCLRSSGGGGDDGGGDRCRSCHGRGKEAAAAAGGWQRRPEPARRWGGGGRGVGQRWERALERRGRRRREVAVGGRRRTFQGKR